MGGSYVLYTDGAARGNPGPAAIGAVLYRTDGGGFERVADLSRSIGDATNNVAEYLAVLEGLELASGLDPEVLILRADSQLLIRQLEGTYRVKAPHLQPIYRKVREGLRRFRSVRLEHVPREQNAVADGLANAALDA